MSSSRRHRPFLIVLSSPSGAGKTSVYEAALRRDRGLAYSVSATTRPRRPGERNGRSYHFVTAARFRRLLRSRALLEHARVYDTWYGTPRQPLLRHFREGRDVIADLDVQGMRSCRRAMPGMVGIFITAPGRTGGRPGSAAALATELRRRLRARGTDSAESVARRQAELERELAAIPEFDYVVVNDRLSDAVGDVLAIIRAERLRTSRLLPPAKKGKR
ncbi:guanylate kinase [candidate division WOR-3 bacterium]|nr:guanylate kinase [candidate division WOR-3 bacterium]